MYTALLGSLSGSNSHPPVMGVVCSAGLLGAGSQILRLLLRIPPDWQTITAFPIGLTEETLISEPIFKALYDVTSLKPLDKVRPVLLKSQYVSRSWPPTTGGQTCCKVVKQQSSFPDIHRQLSARAGLK